MALDSEETRARLVEFAARWGGYQGTERSEAQTFLNQLLECFGADRVAVGARFEEATRDGGFMDMIWPGVCLVEMKRPSEAAHIHAHRDQALRYWQSVGRPGAPAPPYVVLCAFHRFEVWKPGDVYTEPLASFDLSELPENSSALLFLAGKEPGFYSNDKLTRDAVALVTDLYAALDARQAADDDVLQDFILQVVWSLFAEDLGLLPDYLLTRILDGLLDDPRRSSVDDLGRMFGYLANKEPRPTHGVYQGTPYANGGLFAKPAEVHLDADELESLRRATDFDWTGVEPAIFGSLLTGGLGRDKQWALGAHYTSEADIMKVVAPTIVEPWRRRLEACESLQEAQAAQRDLMAYVVLDPACGSGNFLYVAYRELRKIESALRGRVRELRSVAGLADQGELSLFPIHNMLGIEIEPFAVKLARVTMWIAHKLAVDRLGVDEQVLPLVDLSGIRQGDALRVPWPRADAIISNPPYHGDRRIRRELGDEYAEWLRNEFGIGLRDYSVYWFRRAHTALERGGRAGIVATNSVSQGRAREPSLEWIVETGGVITNAVSSQPWPGEATVEVSIINWTKEPSQLPEAVVLDAKVIGEPIAPSLVPSSLAVDGAEELPANEGRAFYGCILGAGGPGFIIDESDAQKMLALGDEWRKVIRPLLGGEDLTQDPAHAPQRWVIDFGFMELEEARTYSAAIEIVRARVKPARDRVRRESYRKNWWRFAEPIRGMRVALAGLDRYIACASLTSGRGGFCWVDSEAIPTSQAAVFAFDDYFSMGVLSSAAHEHWARAQSSTFRTDFRYTTTTAFRTFPWPTAGDATREQIADAARNLIARRDELCLVHGVGLTELYHLLRDGAFRELASLHIVLDKAVFAGYGWPAEGASDPDEARRRLLQLNKEISDGERIYMPFEHAG